MSAPRRLALPRVVWRGDLKGATPHGKGFRVVFAPGEGDGSEPIILVERVHVDAMGVESWTLIEDAHLKHLFVQQALIDMDSVYESSKAAPAGGRR